MGFRNGAYAKVWKVKPGKGNYYEAEMSTSRKKQDGTYETDWSYKFVRLVGTAAEQAQSIKDGDSVQIGSCDVTNKYDKERNTTYTNYVIFNFMDNNQNNNHDNSKSSKAKPQPQEDSLSMEDINNEELPF